MKYKILALVPWLIVLLAPCPVFGKASVTVRPLPHNKNSISTAISGKSLHQQAFVVNSLDALAGGQVKSYGGAGQLQQVTVRGLRPNATLVMLDDLVMNSQGDGAYNFGTLLSGSIQSVGTADSPYQMIYHMPGGIVDMAIKRPNDFSKNDVKLEMGDHGSAYAHVQLNHQATRYYYVLHGEGFYTLGMPQISQKRAQGERNRYQNGSVAGALNVDVTPHLNLDLVTRFSESTLHTDFLGSFKTDMPEDTIVHHMHFLRLKAIYDEGRGVAHRVVLGLLHNSHKYNTPVWPSTFMTEKMLVGRYLVTATPRLHEKTQAGFEISHNALSSSIRQHQNIGKVFVMHQQPIMGNWVLGGGVTYHHQSHFKGDVSFALENKYLLDEETAFIATYRSTLRFPTLLDLYGGSVYSVANKSLLPEKSHVVELGIETQWGQFRGKALCFYTQTKDLMYGQLVAASTYRRENGQISNQGAEMTLFYEGAELSGQLSYTYTKAKSLTPGLLDKGFPAHKVYGALDYRMGQATFNATVTFVGPREGQIFALPIKTVKLQPYMLLNAAITYEIGKYFNVFLRGQNIFNQQYQTIAGYRAPGRGFYVGLHARF